MRIIFLAVVFFNISIQAMVEISIPHNGIDRSYLQYIPPNKNVNDPIDLFIGLHGYSGTASGFEKETTGGFNTVAKKYGFMAIYPQGIYFYDNSSSSFVSSWNDLAGSKTKTPLGETCATDAAIYPKYPNCNSGGRCSWTSCNDDIGFIKKVIDATINNKNIRNIYVIGMSNGGMMAQALACEYPELFKGAANIVGMQHKDLSCIPDKPINFIIYGGMKDTTVPPINIRAADGYFYEPMNKTFNSWSENFHCSVFINEEYLFTDNFEQKTASNCKGGITITSILNKDRGHLWPGIDQSVGFCNTRDQSNLEINECRVIKNSWGNEFIVKLLLEL